jgi:hypothetical protein
MIVTMYNEGTYELSRAEIDLLDNTIKIALCTSSYTLDRDAHTFFDDITNEVTGTGYTAGGATLASKTITKDDANDRSVFDAADVSWTSSTITARYGIMYMDSGTASTSPLIACLDFESDQSSSNGTFTIQWNASGIFRFSQGS